MDRDTARERRAPSSRPTRRNGAPVLRASAGFTLLELLIALLILGVGILGISQVFFAADQHTISARDETVAAALVQEIREKILSESFDDLYSMFNDTDTDVPSTVSLPAELWAQHVHEELGEWGRGTIEVESPADDETIPNGMLRMSINVSWQEGSRTISIPHHFNVAKIGA